MTYQVSGTFAEGIGDDVVIAAVMFIIISVPLCYLLWTWLTGYGGGGVVHAESAGLADNIREEQRVTRNQTPPSSSTSDSTAASVRLPSDQTCPVCIDNVRYAFQTNCSHIFCGQCFVSWWQHGRWTGPAKCPVCRQQVTILLQRFTEVERGSNSQTKSDIIQQTSLYNRRFSGEPLAWHEYIRDLPTILRHLMSDFFSFGGLLWMFRMRVVVIFVLGILYLISPLDIIPEALFGFFGLLDDMFIILLLLIYISIIYRGVVVSRSTPHEHAS